MGKLFKEPNIKHNFLACVSSLVSGLVAQIRYIINSLKKKTREKKAEEI